MDALKLLKARQVMDESELNELGDQMAARKQELMAG